MFSELAYLVALTQIPVINSAQARILVETFGSAEGVFNARPEQLKDLEIMNDSRVKQLRGRRDFTAAAEQITRCGQEGTRVLAFTDPDYPQRLLHCQDAPLVLYYRGIADLNHPRMISVVGTRRYSEYGKAITEKFCAGLSPYGALIVSGLASGIDGIAHRAALSANAQTIGVLGHGLQMIYPAAHTGLAREMQQAGGLLTEYWHGVPARHYHFPARNRIVAGISAATVVIETRVKGGSRITAELAADYNREVYAFPGRTTDQSMEGNLALIRDHGAGLITEAVHVAEALRWKRRPGAAATLFAETREAPNEKEEKVLKLFESGYPVFLERIQAQAGLSPGDAAEALLFLEIKGWLRCLPGRKYLLREASASG